MPAGASDLLMWLKVGGVMMPGETRTEVTAQGEIGRQMLSDFKQGKMFEIESFGFGIGDASPAHKPKDAAEPGKTKVPAPHSNLREAPSKVTVQPVTFSRLMDNASTELMQHFIRRTNFDYAALVKRKAAGSTAAGEPYLRFDFKGVLLTGATWTNDEPITENFTFYARAITMRYRPQNPDGSLGAIVPGFWSMVPGETIEPL